MEIESENIAYVKKVERISPRDREVVRSALDWLAERGKEHYPDMNYCDLRKFISDMVIVFCLSA